MADLPATTSCSRSRPVCTPTMADGSFYIETVEVAEVSSYASNRAILDIEFAEYCNGAPIDCQDGEVCNGIETCDPVLGCQSGLAYDCDDGNPCTDDDCVTDQNDDALLLNGSTQYVEMGAAPGLGATQFTLEAWIKWDGGGDAANSGGGGVDAYPIIAKGRGEVRRQQQGLQLLLRDRARERSPCRRLRGYRRRVAIIR